MPAQPVARWDRRSGDGRIVSEGNRVEEAPVLTAAHRPARARRFDWVRFAEAYALLAGIVILGAVFGILRPESFLSWANITTILGSQAVLVVLTLALIIPLTAGDYDLSV